MEDHFLSFFDDKQAILNALATYAPHEFWECFYYYTENMIEDMGYGYGVKCPVCRSSLDGGLCKHLKQHKNDMDLIGRVL